MAWLMAQVYGLVAAARVVRAAPAVAAPRATMAECHEWAAVIKTPRGGGKCAGAFVG